MALRNCPHLLFLAAAFGVGYIVFGVIARVWIRQEDAGHAAREVLYFVMVAPLRAAFLRHPFYFSAGLQHRWPRSKTSPMAQHCSVQDEVNVDIHQPYASSVG